MLSKSQVTCWVVTDGKLGMENQCLGLAEALGYPPVVKRIKLRSPWKQLSPFLRQGLQWAFDCNGDSIAPPWPDLLIATGRHSVPASLLARRATMNNAKPTFTVQIQNPVINPARFDLVVVPRHDGLSGANVMTTRGSLHRVTPEFLVREAAALQPTIAHLPKPWVAVLIGGSNAVYQLTPQEMTPLTAQLNALAKATGCGLMVTPSRRTGEANIEILKEGLKDVPAYIWDFTGTNPYYGMLGLADAIIATADSVGMVSEACTTGKPVHIIELPGGSEKFRRFHQSLRDDGITRTFTGKLEQWSYQPLNDMALVAERVRAMMGLSLV